MDYAQFLAILGTTIGALIWLHRDLKEDIRIQNARFEEQSRIQSERTDKLYEEFCEQSRRQREESQKQTERTDQLYEMFQEGLRQQTERTDKLYQMFIDLVRSKK